MDVFVKFVSLLCTMVWLIIIKCGMCDNNNNNNDLLLCQPIDSFEVQALIDAARTLGKTDWNCTDDPCAKGPTCWNSVDTTKLNYVNNVTCLCQNGKYHISIVFFKAQDLPGVLPGSLSKLPSLQMIDLSRNLLSGPIPREWASMKNLTSLSVMANNLSGPIPAFLGNITSLTYLSFETNWLSGDVPAELGQLVNLQSLTLSDNNLTGRFPEELKNLTSLTELRLSSNNFEGRLPDYFGSWVKLLMLEVQGSGFEGPVPPSISFLNNVTELRISDLSGEGSKFPSLQNCRNLKSLVLRNCNIFGAVPEYLTTIPALKMLDLSFNSLAGLFPSLPDGNHQFTVLQELFLTHNVFTGQIPKWITENTGVRNNVIDLSYNRFDEITGTCDDFQYINLFRSFKGATDLESTLCIRESLCSKHLHSLHINCGGERTVIGKRTYEEDKTAGGAAKFVHTGVWGFSSSGDYWNTRQRSGYILNDPAAGPNEQKLFQEARIAATSLTYYGLCLASGNYTVTLRFSEIVFASNKSFFSLGKRKFDIYIQEKLVYKDFDILSNNPEAHQPVKKEFYNINVNNSIEIRLTYAGKGSTAIPDRITGAYGPLISAISVEAEFKIPMSRRTIIGISVGSASLIVFIIISVHAVYWWRNHVEDIPSREEELKGLDLQAGLITYRQINAATNNFDPGSKIGEGGFGSVYLGTLLDGTNIAVKQLSSKSSQGHREFINEIGMISGLHHPNLVRLYGCCVEGKQLFLIYEYMENNNLARALFGADSNQLILDWPTRKRVFMDTARGLMFLHEESTIKIVHRDIKATNVLLDRNFNAKISDFGLAKLDDDDHTHISTRVAGTIGYMAPEYAMWGYLTYKADVFSFGVLLLEIVAGRSNTKLRPEENHFCLLDWASVLKQKGDLREIVDPRLGKEYNEEEATRMLKIALLCTNGSPELRPHMSLVLAMLEGSRAVVDSTLDPNMEGKDWLYQFYRSQNDQTSDFDTQSLIISGDAPGGEASSTPDQDLYPVNLLQHKGYNYH